MMIMKKVNYLFVVTSLCLLVLVTGARATQAAEQDSHAHNEGGDAHTEISTAIAQQAGIRSQVAGASTIERTLSSYGRLAVDPESQVHVQARFPGLVIQVEASLGDMVSAGDTLAIVESNDSLQRYPLTTPVSGTVSQRHISAGEVTGAQALFTIVNFDRLWAELKIFPGQRADIAAGQTVRLNIDEIQHEASIHHLLPDERGSPYVIARAEIINTDGMLSPGRLVSARVIVERIEASLVVDNRALQSLDGYQVVFVQEGDVFAAREVELGRSDNQFSEVLSGLHAGEHYVVDNSYLVKADIEKSGASHAH